MCLLLCKGQTAPESLRLICSLKQTEVDQLGEDLTVCSVVPQHQDWFCSSVIWAQFLGLVGPVRMMLVLWSSSTQGCSSPEAGKRTSTSKSELRW